MTTSIYDKRGNEFVKGLHVEGKLNLDAGKIINDQFDDQHPPPENVESSNFGSNTKPAQLKRKTENG